jgi:hypothetical protein
MTVIRQLETITLKLFDYCRSNNWAGYDPYDALNSELFKRLPFLDSWLPRLALTQLLKRSPINFRPLLMIPKTQNPKALALFLMALLNMEKTSILEDKGLIPLMVQSLADLRSTNTPSTVNCRPSTVNRQLETENCEPSISVNCQPSTVNPYWCWGYSFPWQGRSVLAPRGEPNLVCTVFVANALLDLYESERCQPEIDNRKLSTASSQPSTVNCQPSTGNRKPSTDNLLRMATSAADYLLNELYWSEGDNAGFSYPLPSFHTRVHNANFLGAALFCRIYKHTGEKKFLEPALKAARYSASMQLPDGAWYYGEHETQHWVDNFHTGYNLGALRTICKYLNTDEFQPHIQRGFMFYRNNFFCEDGAPKYFHNKTYPIDIHCVAKSIITLIEFQDLDQNNVELAHRVFDWAIANMWDERGYFYYQVTPYYKNKISYMRWSQSWMLLALATLATVDREP